MKPNILRAIYAQGISGPWVYRTYTIDEMNSKANHTLELLKNLEAKKTLTKKQLKIYKAFSHATLKRSASSYAHHNLKQPSLDQDEELQLLACAYANLFLAAPAHQSMK
jgi:hypothetical protein